MTPRPERLLAQGLGFRDLLDAIARNTTSSGAGYIERNGEQYLVRAPGNVGDLDQIRSIAVSVPSGIAGPSAWVHSPARSPSV